MSASVAISIPIAAAPVAADLAIELALPLGTLTFRQADAVDLGDYVGPFVRQRCFMQRQGAWTVFFRPDADGRRDEIVVEYGAYDFSASPPQAIGTPAHILSPFTATIKRGATTLASVTAPKQYWMTRWRWQSAPRSIVRSYNDLVVMKAILPLSEAALWNNPPNYSVSTAVWSGPMGRAGLTSAMGTTGDRQEIGPITNLQGSYLLRGNVEARAGMLAQAEAVGSFPFWVRNMQTNNLLDIFAHPYQVVITSANLAKYPRLSLAPPANDTDFFRLDNAHFPSVAFVPWLLTDDPYFLEGAQMTAIFGVMENNYNRLNENLPGLAYVSQKRGTAWALREIWRMAAFTPDSLPSWLQTRSLFRKMSDDTLIYAQRFMASQIKACRIFHMMFPINGAIGPWQEGYLLSCMGWARWTRVFPEWDVAIDWAAEVLLQITADPALGGWDRRWPAPYYININRARTSATNLSIQNVNIAYNASPEPYAAETPDSWGELWTLYKQRSATEGRPITIGTEDRIYEGKADNPVSGSSDLNYFEWELGGLAALALGGTPGAREHAAWLRAKIPALWTSYNNPPSSFRYAYTAS